MTDVNEVEKPIVASSSQGSIDAAAATMRYPLTVLAGFVAILGFLQTKDIVGILEYIRSAEGVKFIAALVAIATPLYGIFKTWRRGAQVATVAASPDVPNRVAQLKS